MVYDAGTGQLLLFGGSALTGKGGGFFAGTWVWTDGSYLGGTWIWDGTTWTPHIAPPAPAEMPEPSPRDTGSFVFDAATGTGVLFGGFDAVTRFTDTWTWNGFTWTRQNPATSPSDPTFGWMAAYDAVTGQVLLFGGQSGHGSLSDLWAWNGGSWQQNR
jgi:hypothetical protein